MKIFSPHRRRMEAKRRYGSKEFQNKIKKAQGYKRIFDARSHGAFGKILHWLRLDSAVVLIPLLLVAGAGIYYLFISDYFLVQNIEVSGNEQIGTSQIQEAVQKAGDERWMLIPKNHLLLLSGSYALDLISEELPLVKEISRYKRVWPDGVKFEVVERRPGFAFVIDGRPYLVDEEGVVVKPLDDVGSLPVVHNQLSEGVQVGERLNNTKLVAFVMSVLKHWPAKINSQIKEMRVPGKAAQQIQVMSNEGWGVFFDTNRPSEGQVSNLALILSRQIPAQNRLKLAYIDLRFDKWAYYCYKDSPCVSQPNNEQKEGEGADKGEEKVEVE